MDGDIVCEKRETIKKTNKFWYFNKMSCKLNNLECFEKWVCTIYNTKNRFLY